MVNSTRILTIQTAQRTMSVQPLDAAKKLFCFIALLLILNLVGVYLVHILHVNTHAVQILVHFFDFNEEDNIPTFFSVLLLLLASSLLLIIAKLEPIHKMARRWLFLSAIFLFLSLDESISIHERFSNLTNNVYHIDTSMGGYLHYSWVVPYALGLIILTVIYAPFIWQLPPFIRTFFVLSGCVFVTGAMGLEIIEAHYSVLHGVHNLHYALLYTLEEVMEMSGVVLFIYALLTYIAQKHGEIKLSVTNSEQKPVVQGR